MNTLCALKKTLALTGSVFILLYALPAFSQARKEYLLRDNWKFTKGDPAQPDLNTKSWESLSIPHDWAIKGPFEGNNDVQYVQVIENLDICHREDPTRQVTMGMNHYDNVMNNNFASAVDIPGFNYKPNLYESANTRLPQGFLLGTETDSTLSSRGVYKFPVEFAAMKLYPDHQSSSYDFECGGWSQIPDDEFAKQDSLEFVTGEFVWTGFDYLGEPTPYDEVWPSHSSYFGILDLAGLPKERYYLYRSKWNKEKATLHVLPHWTFPGREGQVTPVFAYTSYPSAELFINGKSMGGFSKNNSSNTSKYRLMWKDVKYEPGTIKVIAYDQKGRAAAEETINTAGKPDHLVLEADRMELTADGKDLSYITAKIVDKDGNLCPDAENELTFRVSGAGRYKVVANGDATSLEMFHHNHMKAFHGMLVVTVQSADRSGDLVLSVTGKQLKKNNLTIKTR
jgi:beta-galactosidase